MDFPVHSITMPLVVFDGREEKGDSRRNKNDKLFITHTHTHTLARAQRYAIKLKALYTVNIWYKFDYLNSYLTSH